MSLDSPTILPLGPDALTPDWSVTAPGTFVGAWQTELEGMESAAVQLRCLYGSGGTGIVACLQSSLDQGQTAYDVAVVKFATAQRLVIFEVAGRTTTAVIAPGSNGLDAAAAPENEGILAPVLGDRLRLVLIVTGTYAGTTLSARVLAS